MHHFPPLLPSPLFPVPLQPPLPLLTLPHLFPYPSSPLVHLLIHLTQLHFPLPLSSPPPPRAFVSPNLM